tara:strand:+ start:53 stop:904 length:852 start_codon:yes stop_codon:yes gene_type:complete
MEGEKLMVLEMDRQLLSELGTSRIGQLTMLPLNRLEIDLSYGRSPNELKVRAMAHDFSEAAAGVLMVSHRYSLDRYVLMDGGHRCGAMRLSGYTEALCSVYEYLSIETEAAIWVLCNSRRKNPSGLEMFKAALVEQQPQAIAINEAAQEAGCIIPDRFAGSTRSPNVINAVGALQAAYRLGGKSSVRDTLDLLLTTWPDDRDATIGSMIGGMAMFLSKYRDDITLPAVGHKLRLHRPAQLLMDAGVQARTYRGNARTLIAKTILNLYNSGRRTQRLKDKFIDI